LVSLRYRNVPECSTSVQLISKDGKPIVDHLLKKSISVDGSTKAYNRFDLFVVPGGNVESAFNDKELIDEIRRLSNASSLVASVCTGAFLIAKAGVADGKTVATHHNFYERFRQSFPRVNLAEGHRYFRDGSLWSSAGISAGIDLSLRLVAATWTPDVAKKVQDFLEYRPEPPFPCGKPV